MLARRFQEDWESGRIDRGRVMVVRYDRLMSDFSATMGQILEFIGHAPDAALLSAIAAQDAKQRSWKSGHRYDLARFGLTEERVEADLGSWRRCFLPEPGDQPDGAAGESPAG